MEEIGLLTMPRYVVVIITFIDHGHRTVYMSYDVSQDKHNLGN